MSEELKKYLIDVGIWLSLFVVAAVIFSTGMGVESGVLRAAYLLCWSITLHYLNFVLMSNCFVRREYAQYFCYTLLLILLISFLRLQYEFHILPEEVKPLLFKERQPKFLFYFLSTFSGCIVSSLVLYNKFLKDSEKTVLKIQQQQAKDHLNLLQAQIQPHLLFNTLNNIYSLIIEKREEAGEAVLKLSEILRYAIYSDDECEEFSIEKEAKQMETLIWLFQLKSDNRYNITFSKQVSGGRVLPMLFFPLVENALKHCDFAINPQAFIRINLVSSSEKIAISITNTHQSEVSSNNSKGLGLSNVKERLNIFYKNRYVLAIDDSSNSFKVKLEIYGANQMRGN